MFISGGENVYPPEVEEIITEHPAVAEAVVVGVPDDQWGTVGKAVVELDPEVATSHNSSRGATETDGGDRPLTRDRLEAFLDGKIARFKIPKYLTIIDEIPLSGPSKIDRAAIESQFGGDKS